MNDLDDLDKTDGDKTIFYKTNTRVRKQIYKTVSDPNFSPSTFTKSNVVQEMENGYDKIRFSYIPKRGSMIIF